MKTIARSACLAVAVAFGTDLSAATLPIVSYSVSQTPVSGFGCWFHNFNGTVVDTGRVVGGSVSCSPDAIGHVFDYANGSGTLNDGLTDTTHLLLTRSDSQGVPLLPVIELHLGSVYTLNEIRLLKGSFTFTQLTWATVEFGGIALGLPAVPIAGDPLSVVLDLRDTVLAGVPTSQVSVKAFQASFYGLPIDQFGIGEVVVDGDDVILAPTTKEQCKNGGWRHFDFRNQGQCIQFVNTGK